MSLVFNYSAINTAYDCYHKYKLRYIDNVDPGVHSGDMAFGSAMHSAINAYFRGEDPIAVFDMFWGSIRDFAHEYSRFDWDALKGLGHTLLERWVERHAKKFEPFKVEETIKADLAEFTLQGTPDFIGLYDGVPSIVDWKAYMRPLDKAKIITNEQLYGYAYLAKKVFDFDAKQLAYVGFIKTEQRIQSNLKIELTQQKMDDMLGNIVLMMRDLSTRKEFPKNRNNCQYCPYFKRCYGE